VVTSLVIVDAIWEQWDLVCDPSGCDPLDQLIRVMVYGFLVIAVMVFYAAVRPWTENLPKTAGVAISLVSAVVIVWVARNVVVSNGSLRSAGVITALGLLAVWIGRPGFTEQSGPEPTDPDASISGDASPTSSMR
jgi:hypothetical protein